MFITLEGPEGSGKTSQIAPLAEFLRQSGKEVLVTREPGGTPIGDQIRAVLMQLDNTAMHPNTEILLFLASRAQLVAQLIRPALAAGKIVLCDRYADSTLAYQGYGHGNDLGVLRQLLEFATGGLKPDLTLLLDIDIKDGIRRKQSGGSEWNRLDANTLAFHERVRQGYYSLAAAEPDRWVCINCDKPASDVQASMRQVIAQKFGFLSINTH
jgi:dTMP kinase